MIARHGRRVASEVILDVTGATLIGSPHNICGSLQLLAETAPEGEAVSSHELWQIEPGSSAAFHLASAYPPQWPFMA